MKLNITIQNQNMERYLHYMKKAFNNPPLDLIFNNKKLLSFQFPKNVYIVNENSLENITGILKMSDASFSEISNKVNNNDLKSLNKYDKKIHRTPWGCYVPDEDVIFLCPESIEKLAKDCHAFLNYSTFDDIFVRYLRNILIHEITHSTFNRSQNLINEIRLSEGLANWIPNVFTDEFGRRLMAFKAVNQKFVYNYFFLFNRWNKVVDFLKLMGKEKQKDALQLFYQYIKHAAEGLNMVEHSGKMKFGSDFNGLMGFGSKSSSVGIGGKLNYLCNYGGQAIISEINLLDGFLHKYSIIITNKINNMPYYMKPYYNSIPQNIYIVDKNNININKIVKNGKAENIPEIIDQTLIKIRKRKLKLPYP